MAEQNESGAVQKLRASLNRLQEEVVKAARNPGSLSDLGKGMGEGFRVTPEDRRDMLWMIRDIEGKSEPPRATQTLATQPGVDLLRQIKTIDPDGLGRLIPLQPFDDRFFMERANAGLNLGPNPNQMPELGRELQTRHDPEGLARYKEGLRNQTLATRVGQVAGTALSDITNDSLRSLWWLINAPQAVTNLLSETGGAVMNPDLFARREVKLDEALDKGWVTYKNPTIKEETITDRARDIAHDEELSILNKFASGGFVDPESSYTAEDMDKDLAKLNERSRRKAIKQLQDESRANLGNYRRSRPGVKIVNGRILKNRFNPNLVNAATIVPAALAINQGIGLLDRREGYAATVPDELDETKTANAIAEVASRYLLGREGRLLDQEDFLLERPDETAQGYQAYKGYLRDRDIDLNPFDDGKINLGGVLKTNPDGIRGAEVSFLGKSLPWNDTLVPTAAAIGGTALGAALTNAGSIRFRRGMKGRKGLNKLNVIEVLPRDEKTGKRRYVDAKDSAGLQPKDTFINRVQAKFDKDDGWKHNARVLGTVAGMGLAGAGLGTAAGNAMEDDRRRKEFVKNKGSQLDYDIVKERSQRALDRKRELIKSNPNASEQKEESKVGFNKRSYQQSLLTGSLEQQALIDQITDEQLRRQAQSSQDKSLNNLAKAEMLDRQMQLEKTKDSEGNNLTPYEAASINYANAKADAAEQAYLRESRKRRQQEEEEAVPLFTLN